MYYRLSVMGTGDLSLAAKSRHAVVELFQFHCSCNSAGPLWQTTGSTRFAAKHCRHQSVRVVRLSTPRTHGAGPRPHTVMMYLNRCAMPER